MERFNHTLLDALRCCICKTSNQWDEYLPQILGALRASVNRSTGLTPNVLMLGRSVDIVFPSKQLTESVDPESYVCHLVENSKMAAETARERLKATQKVMKRNYDLHTNFKQHKVGDDVYILDTSSGKVQVL